MISRCASFRARIQTRNECRVCSTRPATGQFRRARGARWGNGVTPVRFYQNDLRGENDRIGTQHMRTCGDSEIPVETKARGLYIVRRQLPGPPPEHHHLYISNNTLIHIDAITHRVMMVQHYDRNKRDEYMCGIPMWKAR